MVVVLLLRTIYLLFHSLLFWFVTGSLHLLRPHVAHSSIIIMCVGVMSQGCLPVSLEHALVCD